MQTLKELYKVGPGPSSSHTLAPARACRLYLENYPDTATVDVHLYGSLSLTGKGHFTDKIIQQPGYVQGPHPGKSGRRRSR